MLNDLNKYFAVKGAIEFHDMPCYKIVNKTDNSKLLKSLGGESKWRFDSTRNGKAIPLYITSIENKSIDEIVDKFNSISYQINHL